MSNYPEHDKLRPVSEKSQAIGEFLAWLEEGGLGEETGSVELARHLRYYVGPTEHRESVLTPLMMPKTDLLARYFEIDLEKIEDEKLAMLAGVRRET